MSADPFYWLSYARGSSRTLACGTLGEDRIRASFHEAGHAVALQRLSFPAKLLNVTITGSPDWRGRVHFRPQNPSHYDSFVAREFDRQLHAACCLVREDEVAARSFILEVIVGSSDVHAAHLEVELLLAWLGVRASKAAAHEGIVPWTKPRGRLARSLAMDLAMIALAGWGAEEVAFGGSGDGYRQDYVDAEGLARGIVPADEVEPYLLWLAVRVRSLLRSQWWKAVEGLAARLREADPISGPEADAIISAAFDEENEPILL